MKSFRLKAQLDEHNEYVCLNCKKEFICLDNPLFSGWVQCPMCLVHWDGQFNVRHKRYPQLPPHKRPEEKYELDRTTSEIISSANPRLIVEYKLANSSIWHLQSHCCIGRVITDENCSSSMAMFRAYFICRQKFLCDSYYPWSKAVSIRLRKLTGDKSVVLKQSWRPSE